MTNHSQVHGFKGVIDPYRFASDPANDRGRLRAPYQDGAIVLRYDAESESWVIQTRSIMFFVHGVGESAPETGYEGVQHESSTALLKGGFASGVCCFTTQGIELRASEFGFSPTAINGELVSRSGKIRQDVRGIAAEVALVFLGGVSVEFSQHARAGRDYLGKGIHFAAEGGAWFKRPILLSSMKTGAVGQSIRLSGGGADVRIPRDKAFDPPTDGTVVVFNIELLAEGYFSDEHMYPVINESDIYEAVQASKQPPQDRDDVPPKETAGATDGTSDVPSSVINDAPKKPVRETFFARLARRFRIIR